MSQPTTNTCTSLSFVRFQHYPVGSSDPVTTYLEFWKKGIGYLQCEDELFSTRRNAPSIIIQAFATPSRRLPNLCLESVQIKKDLMRPQNKAILALLDKWSKEPPIEDDAWWEEFNQDLREIRKSGWGKI